MRDKMDNPFAAPESDLAFDKPADDTNMRVEGKFLVVRSPVNLPLYCVKTDQPITQRDTKKRSITWCPPIYGLTILLGGLLFIVVYLIVRRTCVITYGVTPEVRSKYRNRMLIKSAIALLLFGAIFVAANFDPIAIIITVVLFGIALISLFVGNSPLSVTKSKKREFWMSGCSSEFLARIRGQLADEEFVEPIN